MSAPQILAPKKKWISSSQRAGLQSSDEVGHSIGSTSQAAPLSLRELKALLSEFERTVTHQAPELKQSEQNKALLGEFQRVHRVWERRQVYEAEDFNVLRTMRLTTKELCHSDILAWLLDHRLDGFGTHAQGKCGFRLFLKAVGLPAEFADADYRVAREVSGREARMDIVIEAERNFIIGIENKVTSHEILGLDDGEHQTQCEWRDLVRRADMLYVRHGRVKPLFLTPDSQRPASENFAPISWRQVADVFEEFAAKAKSPMVALFAQHYAKTVRQDVAAESENKEEENE